MDESGLSYTRFASDITDKVNNVWGLVFGNLEEFGSSFALGGWGKGDHGPVFVPTVYGPITIQILPRALARAESVAVSLVSAGQSGFDRGRDSLPSAEAVEACYFEGRQLKFTSKLAEEHGLPYAIHPEWSLEVEGGVVPFEDAELIRVEPIEVAGCHLLQRVQGRCGEAGVRVFERNYFASGRRALLNALAGLAAVPGASLTSALEAPETDEATRDYLRRVRNSTETTKQFERYLRYTREGTFRPYANGDSA